jgi:hypothetical protein
VHIRICAGGCNTVDGRKDKQDGGFISFLRPKPGGRLAISDIVAVAPLPPHVQKDLALVSACVGGAATVEDTRAMLENVGFRDIRIEPVQKSRDVIEACAQGSGAADYVVSAYVQAVKPLR